MGCSRLMASFCFELLLVVSLCSSCFDKLDIASSENSSAGQYRRVAVNLSLPDLTDTTEYNWPSDTLLIRKCSGIEAALRRARQLSDIRWSPLLSMPSCYGTYDAKSVNAGMPYSLANKTDSQIGTQVSLHTFMTALQNRNSVIYTENLRNAPYYGFGDSAPYYGTTCSNSIMFVLGIEPPYYTRMIDAIPGMKKASDQKPEAIEICDVLWRSGHVMMVYDIERGVDGSINSVSIFETTRANAVDTWICKYSYKDFSELWEQRKLVRYQYTKLNYLTDYISSVFIPLVDEPSYSFSYNYDLCPTRGDRSSYLEGKVIEISILNPSFDTFCLYKDGKLYGEELVNGRSVISLDSLGYGQYKACLAKWGKRSGFVYFEVINAKVSHTTDAYYRFEVESANASPRYIGITNDKHVPYNYYALSDLDRKKGAYNLRVINSSSATHYKMYFKGRFGVVATDLKSL